MCLYNYQPAENQKKKFYSTYFPKKRLYLCLGLENNILIVLIQTPTKCRFVYTIYHRPTEMRIVLYDGYYSELATSSGWIRRSNTSELCIVVKALYVLITEEKGNYLNNGKNN